jgi:hyperosmotically inducible protein
MPPTVALDFSAVDPEAPHRHQNLSNGKLPARYIPPYRNGIRRMCTKNRGVFMAKNLFRKAIHGFLFSTLLFGSWTLLPAQPTPQQAPASDNSKVNARDRDKAEPTADQQKENRSDRELTRQIRRAIVQDKSLSTYAHNVKIISQNGHVTLKGPVRSEEEKQAIEAKAGEVAGASNVESKLDVKPKQ